MNNNVGFSVVGADVDACYYSLEEMRQDSWCFEASELAQIRALKVGESVEIDLGEDGGVVKVTKVEL